MKTREAKKKMEAVKTRYEIPIVPGLFFVHRVIIFDQLISRLIAEVFRERN